VKEFVLVPLYKPNDIFEECTRRALIIKNLCREEKNTRNILQDFDLGKMTSDLYNEEIKVYNALHKNVHVVVFDIAPSPQQAEVGTVYSPHNPFESGIDFLEIHRRSIDGETIHETGTADSLMCFGYQNKWSDEDTKQDALSAPDFSRAYGHFTSKMEARGWKRSQLFFVLLAQRNLTGINDDETTIIKSKETTALHINQSIAIAKPKLETWLCPTVWRMHSNMQRLAVSLSSHTRMTATEDEIREAKLDEKTRYLTFLAKYPALDTNVKRKAKSTFVLQKTKDSAKVNKKDI
jgi:hypothetical protein